MASENKALLNEYIWYKEMREFYDLTCAILSDYPCDRHTARSILHMLDKGVGRGETWLGFTKFLNKILWLMQETDAPMQCKDFCDLEYGYWGTKETGDKRKGTWRTHPTPTKVEYAMRWLIGSGLVVKHTETLFDKPWVNFDSGKCGYQEVTVYELTDKGKIADCF